MVGGRDVLESRWSSSGLFQSVMWDERSTNRGVGEGEKKRRDLDASDEII